MSRLSLLFAVLLVVPLFGFDSPKEGDDKTETVGIEGTWKLTEYNSDGEKSNLDPSFPFVMTFHGKTFTGAVLASDLRRGSYCIDPTRKPLNLDQLSSYGPFKGITLKCIYQIDGDTLRIACSLCEPDRRPQGFNDKGVAVETYKRVK